MNKRIKNLFIWIRSEKALRRLSAHLLFLTKQKGYVARETRGNGGDETFAHVTYYVASNAGDTVLSQCVRRTLEGGCRVKNWELISVTDPVSDDTLRRIDESDKLVIGGGGLFLPDTNENDISGWQWAISPEDMEQIRSKVCVFSVGYNYFPGQKPEELFVRSLVTLVKKSAFFGLRNRGSVRAVKEILPEELRDKVVFQPCTTTVIRKVYGHELPTKRDSRRVAVNMAFDREDLRFGQEKEWILSQVAHAVRGIEKRGYQICYVCHCKNDDRFLPYLRRAGVKYKLVDLSQQYPGKVLAFYNSVDLVMGMRGHAQMIPFGVNTEIISLGTHDKMRWFLEDIDAADWYVDLLENPTDLAKRIFRKFVKVHERDRERTKQRLIRAQDELWRVTCKNIKRISEL